MQKLLKITEIEKTIFPKNRITDHNFTKNVTKT